MSPSRFAPAFGALALLAAGCGEPAVRETLELQLAGDGSSEVAFTVEIPAIPADAPDPVRDYLAERRLEYLEGWDAWAARFDRAGAARESLRWEKVEGDLRTLERTARFAAPRDLAGFFADTDLTVLFLPDPWRSELVIQPGRPSRATREQVERLEETLGDWSESVARYLEGVAELYAYLEARPRRATPVFRALFEDEARGLRGHEEERLERLAETVFEVLDVAGRTEDAPESLESLARLVYDPFPAELSVTIDGAASTVVGFVARGDGGYAVPPLGLERALVDLERRWVEPPLLTIYERHERLGEASDLDLSELVERHRQVHALPTATEISAAVAEALRPEAEYRLVWRPAAED